MKTIFFANVWRTITAMLLITFLVSSCTKKKDPEPDLATRVSGTYTFSEMSYDGSTRPADQTNLKGTIVLSALSPDKVKMKLDIRLKSDNEEFIVGEVSDVTLVNSAGSVDLIYNAEPIAGITGNKITIKGVDPSGVNFTISGVK